METTNEKRIRLYFDISVLIKGAISFLEIVAGVVVFFVPIATLVGWVAWLTQRELAEDPGNILAAHVLQLVQGLSAASGTFIAVYLLTRGLIKLALIIAMLKNQLWAYPSSLVVLGLFVAYQIYEFAIGHSVFIAALTIFDLIVMYFIWREYKILRAHTPGLV